MRINYVISFHISRFFPNLEHYCVRFVRPAYNKSQKITFFLCVREPREDEEESFALKRKISWVPSLPEGESSLCGIKYVCIYENINNMLKVPGFLARSAVYK